MEKTKPDCALDYSDNRRHAETTFYGDAQMTKMLPLHYVDEATAGQASVSTATPMKALYRQLMQPQPDASARAQAKDFLEQQLAAAEQLDCDLPAQPDGLLDWIRERATAVTHLYAEYLESRRAGEPRRYFATRAHALYFLRHVGPTKMVDGAWLYGVLQHWQDPALRPLVRTYLEELGDGVPEQNHVVLYKLLLSSNECDEGDVADEYYQQGAIQLALGHLGSGYLPEVIGFNLGYEQLPLHLLITSYELAELGIDPYYFQLHVTIDNSGSGHAQKAAQAVLENLPVVGDRDEFYRRVCHGYQLNDLGIGTTQIIAGFDLEQQLLQMLEQKRNVAGMVHSDYCKIDGRTVNQWLGEPGQIRDFLSALEAKGWIRRNQPPEDSRFWNLLQGNRAPMFGVFNGYEQQLLHDWIAGPQATPSAPGRRRYKPVSGGHPANETETAALAAELKELPQSETDQRLIELLSPATHFSAAGLFATRLFSARVQ